MCGIWAFIQKDSSIQVKNSYDAFKRIQERGPDRSFYVEHGEPYNAKIGFHRLSIMDPSIKGDQPFVFDTGKRVVNVICNGEIYNFKQIAEKYNIELKSGSDCEVIPHLYIKYGIETVIKEIRGEFAFVIIDVEKESGDAEIYCSRDPLGIRPLFIFVDPEGNYINFSSELKGLVAVYNKNVVTKESVNIVKPAHYMLITRVNGEFIVQYERKYYEFPRIKKRDTYETDLDKIKKSVLDALTYSVECRMHADRPIGCALSGGLDSSSIASILANALRKEGKGRILKTFSIGLEGSTDEPYAKMAAEYIGSEHTHFKVTQDECIDAIKIIIYKIETYDLTTIRASVFQYLLCKKISQTTDIKVVFIGDVSDEVTGGYLYFHSAPSPEDAHHENVRLLTEIGEYDVKRADRGVSDNGLEARVPFSDIMFIDTYLSINPEFRVPINGVEKWLLRESLKPAGLLPDSVLYRKKEAFSDGGSSVKKSWYQIVQEHANQLYTDKYFNDKQKLYKHNPPPSKEALYYREWYESFFGENVDHIIPHYWLPKWVGNISEPSARVLQHYQNKENAEVLE
jgi:asparagine synthase (glutamine-hydrolysing)